MTQWKAVVLLTIAVAVAGPALAQKVWLDYDRDYDGSRVSTFAFVFTPEPPLAERSPGLHSRIVNGIRSYLTAAGLKQVDGSADVNVTYHASGTEELRFDTMTWGYGYPTGWYAAPYWGSTYTTTTVSRYARGTLVVDVWDTATNKLVWRGVTEAAVPANSNAVDKAVDRALQKMVKKWRKLRAKAKNRR